MPGLRRAYQRRSAKPSAVDLPFPPLPFHVPTSYHAIRMNDQSQPKGVLKPNYSENRAKKKELYFRYRVRATAVIQAWQKHAPGNNDLRLLDLGAADGKTIAYMAANMPLKEAVGIE